MPELFEPPMRMSGPDSGLKLFEGEVLVEKDGKSIVAKAIITYEWSPSAGVQLKLAFPNTYPGDLDELVIRGKSLSMSGKGFARNIGSKNLGSGSFETYYDGFLNELSVGAPSDVDTVLFHLANYHMTALLTKAVDITWDDWVLSFANEVERETLKAFLERQGPRTVINYDCRLRRQDGKPFSPEVLADSLEALGMYFSFIRGAECFPILIFAYRDGKLVWANLSENRVDPWTPENNWAASPSVYGPATVTLVDPYWKARKGWSALIRRVVYWYDQANTMGNLDTAIILIQVALEALAWHELERGSASPSGKDPAFVKFEQLLAKSKIPTDIPKEVLASGTLASWIKNEGIKSGPEVLTRVRNALVHSTDSKVAKNLDPLSQADLLLIRNLGLLYVELVLLSVFGHDGEYVDRLSGAELPVPWK